MNASTLNSAFYITGQTGLLLQTPARLTDEMTNQTSLYAYIAFLSHINPIHSAFKSYRFHTACIQFDLAQRFNHPFPSSFHDWNSEVEEKRRNKNKDLKKKKQNVGSVYTSKGEGGGI